MAIRDILVCLDATDAGEHRLKIAAALANRHKAFLSAAYLDLQGSAGGGAVYGPGAVGIGIPLPLADDRAREPAAAPEDQPAPTHADILERRFRDALHLESYRGEWHLFDRGETDRLIALAKTTDLVVMGQRQPDIAGGNEFPPQQVVMESGRPLLVVPYVGDFQSIGKRVLIGWDGTGEAARAVHDALPLMADAAAVSVVTVAANLRGLERAHESLQRIVHHLTRHGLPARPEESPQGDISIADLLLSRAADLDADLLVIGAYHHSRVREALIGGVSQELLQHMTVPVLMSH
ncbi:MAG TPA: universal stress protein [Stellaceae bacterium]|nr:universal stress protein [Stellaceae bacterium]